MPIKYTVTYILPPNGDVSIFDTRPAPSAQDAASVTNLVSTASWRIENSSLIYDLVFPTFSAYQNFIDLKPSLNPDRISWLENNQIDVQIHTEYIE